MTEIKELIEKLRALEAKASPGPWYTADWSHDDGPLQVTVEFREPEILLPEQSGIWPDGIRKRKVASTEEGENDLADAALIAATRTALPQLLSALEALISRSAVMEEALRPFAAATLLNQSAVIVAGDGITQAFDSGKKHVTCLMEEDAGPAFNRARSALSLKAGKE